MSAPTALEPLQFLVDFCASAVPHEWLNRGVFVGTLQSLQPERMAVRIGVFEVI